MENIKHKFLADIPFTKSFCAKFAIFMVSDKNSGEVLVILGDITSENMATETIFLIL